jgi:hypothetical protein
MTRRIKAAAALAMMMTGLAALSMPAPASAGGITMMITPEGETAGLIQQGLQIYSLVQQQKHKKKKNHAQVDQKGNDNAAALSQKGAGNYGLVVQRGHDHTATVSQEGSDNALGVFQFGRNTGLDIVQTGQGNAGLVLQGGW